MQQYNVLQQVKVNDYGCYKPEDIKKTGICFISYINEKTDTICFSDIPVKVKPKKSTSFKLSEVEMQPIFSIDANIFSLSEEKIKEGDFMFDGEIIENDNQQYKKAVLMQHE